MTKEERKLWYDYLRNHPVKFYKQKILGSYIVDFYCFSAKLVIELDGSQHFEPSNQKKDAIRTAYLESLGLKVLRIPNSEITANLRGVCEQIDKAVQERCSSIHVCE